MKKLFKGAPQVFSRFNDGIIPSDELAHKLWESYEPMYEYYITESKAR
jgi:hypothetical protein